MSGNRKGSFNHIADLLWSQLSEEDKNDSQESVFRLGLVMGVVYETRFSANVHRQMGAHHGLVLSPIAVEHYERTMSSEEQETDPFTIQEHLRKKGYRQTDVEPSDD